jgi:hypothetical protein
MGLCIDVLEDGEWRKVCIVGGVNGDLIDGAGFLYYPCPECTYSHGGGDGAVFHIKEA